ncbi:signal peptidase I [Aurantiacibacter sp. MUD61]|uniref:signal peptidase I n=1 Tax=Aurantiacibacter sp. MUD61 TaxID=3009083 RepID=UPI0022F01057|nr:signal peptidase I [Aurantiacibacter sp. MUD61]
MTDEKEQDEKVNWWAELRGLAVMLLVVLLFHTFIAKPFYIPSASMVPNLMVGDRLIVSKYPYGWSWVSASFHVFPRSDWRIAPATPEYGDIVIAVPPDENTDYIKRVIGLPGDTVALVDGQIILNGEPVPQDMEPPVRIPAENDNLCATAFGSEVPCLDDFEPYRVTLENGTQVYEPPTYRETLPNGASYLIIDHMRQRFDNMLPVTVPEGHVFLMGDNRDHSSDSRAPSLMQGGNGLGGPVPLTSVGGRAEIITFSLDGTSSYNPLSWWGALRGERAWTPLRPELRGEPSQ